MAAVIDRLVHCGDVIALKGDSYRLPNRDLGRTPPPTTEQDRLTRPPRGGPTRHRFSARRAGRDTKDLDSRSFICCSRHTRTGCRSQDPMVDTAAEMRRVLLLAAGAKG